MYSRDARTMAINAYRRTQSLRRVANLLGVSKSSIHRWVSSNPAIKRQHDARKATEQAIRMIRSLLDRNPFSTPATISANIRKELGLQLSDSAVRFWMKRGGFSRKKAQRGIVTDELPERRVAFVRDHGSLYDPERVVSIDESAIYFDMKPSRGYCHRSKRLFVPARPGGRMRWSLLMAVTNATVVGWSLIKGSVRSDDFARFVQDLDTAGRDVLLLDNCSIHKTRKAMEVIDDRGLTPCFLPPYTPEFQPIEHSFSVVKGVYKALSSDPERPALMTPPNEQSVRDRLKLAIGALTPSTLSAQFGACWERMERVSSANHEP